MKENIRFGIRKNVIVNMDCGQIKRRTEMGTKLKIAGISIGGIVGLIALVFIFGLAGLGYYKFFEPKKENIRREVFEQTQPYTHGKIQDLAKYYEEYSKAESSDKEAIRQLIIMRFAEFDESKIKSLKLRSFLISMRGF